MNGRMYYMGSRGIGRIADWLSKQKRKGRSRLYCAAQNNTQFKTWQFFIPILSFYYLGTTVHHDHLKMQGANLRVGFLLYLMSNTEDSQLVPLLYADCSTLPEQASSVKQFYSSKMAFKQSVIFGRECLSYQWQQSPFYFFKWLGC